MDRIPEKELMDGEDQARAYAEADFEEPHSSFISHFKKAFAGIEVSGNVIDLGCGAADISIRFARQNPGSVVFGVDGSEAMLRMAALALSKTPELLGRIQLVQALLPDPRLRRNSYRAVISNSLLHHLDDPLILWRAVAELGEAGAPVFVMDLRRPESREAAEWLTETYMGDGPDILREDFFNSLLAAYQLDEVREQLDAAGLGDFNLEETSDRHLAAWGMAPGGEV